jgi:hypothetical protein
VTFDPSVDARANPESHMPGVYPILLPITPMVMRKPAATGKNHGTEGTEPGSAANKVTVIMPARTVSTSIAFRRRPLLTVACLELARIMREGWRV